MPFDDTNHARSPDCKHCKKKSRQEEAAPINALDSSSKLIFTGKMFVTICDMIKGNESLVENFLT